MAGLALAARAASRGSRTSLWSASRCGNRRGSGQGSGWSSGRSSERSSGRSCKLTAGLWHHRSGAAACSASTYSSNMVSMM